MSARCASSACVEESRAIDSSVIQLTAIKLRQKALADSASSFEKLKQLGY